MHTQTMKHYKLLNKSNNKSPLEIIFSNQNEQNLLKENITEAIFFHDILHKLAKPQDIGY